MKNNLFYKIKAVIFANRRYWPIDAELQSTFGEIEKDLKNLGIEEVSLCTDESTVPISKVDGVLLAVPISGSVQSWVLNTANHYHQVVLLASYVDEVFRPEITHKLLYANAAPTFAECWSQLRQKHPSSFVAITRGELYQKLALFRAANKIKNSRIVLIGDMEPWVLSPSRDFLAYEQFGPELIQVSQQELLEIAKNIPDASAKKIADSYWNNAQKIFEPSYEDCIKAGALAAAIDELLGRYDADAAAIACFNLLAPSGTSSCMGVSYLNTRNTKIIACEGDLDSAVTMLLMKEVSKSNLWMANPAFRPDKSICYSHCTAPTKTSQNNTRPYILRNHHESGIGVSLQTLLPLNERVTIARFSSENSSIFMMGAQTFEADYKPVCRTQLNLRPDDSEFLINSLFGCHQVIAFEDCQKSLAELSMILGLKVIQA